MKTKLFLVIPLAALFLTAFSAGAVTVIPPADMVPLFQVVVPQPPNLIEFVKNRDAANRLGKAFFWDMQAGSDGIMACATRHFHAGTDHRLKNQLNPGTNAGDTDFGNNTVGAPVLPQFGPDYTLQPADFPLHLRQTPADDQASPSLRDTNDIVGSRGGRLAQFQGVVPGSAVEDTVLIPDPVFNAVFNFNHFWDGRAHFVFNGETPFGPGDPDAGVWFEEAGALVKRPVAIEFASLASLSVAPPVSDIQMSARGRAFPMIGCKLLSLAPLGQPLVHRGDSVLCGLSRAAVQADGSLAGNDGSSACFIETSSFDNYRTEARLERR